MLFVWVTQVENEYESDVLIVRTSSSTAIYCVWREEELRAIEKRKAEWERQRERDVEQHSLAKTETELKLKRERARLTELERDLQARVKDDGAERVRSKQLADELQVPLLQTVTSYTSTVKFLPILQYRLHL